MFVFRSYRTRLIRYWLYYFLRFTCYCWCCMGVLFWIRASGILVLSRVIRILSLTCLILLCACIILAFWVILLFVWCFVYSFVSMFSFSFLSECISLLLFRFLFLVLRVRRFFQCLDFFVQILRFVIQFVWFGGGKIYVDG